LFLQKEGYIKQTKSEEKLKMTTRKLRKRYIVNLENKGEIMQVVIIAKSPESMYREVSRLYGSFLTSDNGMDKGKGTISYEETELFPTLKTDQAPTSKN
jgi:ribosomal protein S8